MEEFVQPIMTFQSTLVKKKTMEYGIRSKTLIKVTTVLPFHARRGK